ncbi:MAG: hypothetical protein ACYCZN_15985, partial [Candidatus Dormibacteria bacterium]
MKAVMISGASYARLRLPMLTCLRIPTAANCRIALLAAGKVRPIKDAAVVTVTTGAPGSAWSKRSAAEFLRTDPRRAR